MDPDEDEHPRNWHPLWADPEYDRLLLLCHANPRGLLSITGQHLHSAASGDGFAIGQTTITFRDGSTFACTGWAWVDEFTPGTPLSRIDMMALDRAFVNAARVATRRP
jgi:hypothetical protein